MRSGRWICPETIVILIYHRNRFLDHIFSRWARMRQALVVCLPSGTSALFGDSSSLRNELCCQWDFSCISRNLGCVCSMLRTTVAVTIFMNVTRVVWCFLKAHKAASALSWIEVSYYKVDLKLVLYAEDCLGLILNRITCIQSCIRKV
jgi:hypothetical protein